MFNRWHLKTAARILWQGGIVAYPTEAVYGLGCDPNDAEAVLRLLDIKQRPVEKGLILIAADLGQLEPFIATPEPETLRRIDSTWPGPVTWLLPKRRDTPFWLTGGHDTLAVRVTAHPLAAALCREAGTAIVSTSANIAGRRPARTALAVRRIFGHRVDYVLSGAVGDLDKPTQIRDGRTGELVRPG